MGDGVNRTILLVHCTAGQGGGKGPIRWTLFPFSWEYSTSAACNAMALTREVSADAVWQGFSNTWRYHNMTPGTGRRIEESDGNRTNSRARGRRMSDDLITRTAVEQQGMVDIECSCVRHGDIQMTIQRIRVFGT